MKTAWVEFKNIDIFYEKNKIIQDLNLKLLLGEHTVIIGENGSGKSTLVKAITKLKYPRASKYSYIKHFGNRKINIWSLRQRIGFVLSEIDTRIKSNMLSSDVIISGYQGTFGLVNNQNISKDCLSQLENIKELLDLKNISKYYSELSDGQKRRTLIARSIINKPEVLILDEPTSMLDLKARYQLLDVLGKLTKEGMTLLYITNNIDNIIKETKRVIFIKNGKIVLDGNPLDVINSENISRLYNYDLNVSNVEGCWRICPNQTLHH